MLGQRSSQRGLFEADHLYLGAVGRDTFYGFLARQRGELFRDEEFASLYKAGVGRPSVPPSLLATALLLQAHDGVSDEEAKERADFDLRWKVALGIGIEERPFAKSTLQLFRGQLVLHRNGQLLLGKSLEVARRKGYLRNRKLRLALDTTPILGRGAVKDTYNLLADGIKRLVRVLAGLEGERPEAWAAAHDLERYFGSSIKGEAEVDWDDAGARQAFLAGIVADADRLLAKVRHLRRDYPEGSPADRRLRGAADLLSALLLQDVERAQGGGGPKLRQGTVKDRVLSVHDPEMRRGHKSQRHGFNGYKGALAVDIDSQLVTAGTILPANAGDAEEALALVAASEAAVGEGVETTIGDCAYGSGQLRRAFEDEGRPLVAKVPAQTNRGYFTKDVFQIDAEAGQCSCPAGQTTTDRRAAAGGRLQFRFAARVCHACPLVSSCTPARGPHGRVVSLHPQETLLQAARAFQSTAEGRALLRQRQVVEHRIARLVQLGLRQARYFGKTKTGFQLLLLAAVANLTLIAGAEASISTVSSLILALVLLTALTRGILRPNTASCTTRTNPWDSGALCTASTP